jgi:hypothetical protein
MPIADLDFDSNGKNEIESWCDQTFYCMQMTIFLVRFLYSARKSNQSDGTTSPSIATWSSFAFVFSPNWFFSHFQYMLQFFSFIEKRMALQYNK